MALVEETGAVERYQAETHADAEAIAERAAHDIDQMFGMLEAEEGLADNQDLADDDQDDEELGDEAQPEPRKNSGGVPVSLREPMTRSERVLVDRLSGRSKAPPVAPAVLNGLLSWRKDARGTVLGLNNTAHNATLVLQNDTRTHRAIGRDLFTGRVRIMRPINFGTSGVMNIACERGGEDFSDIHESAIATWLGASEQAKGWDLTPTSAALAHAISNAAQSNAFHPIYDRITSAEWDGKPRMETALVRYLRLEDNAYHRQVSRLLFLAAVVRLIEPGHKFDFVPVIEGNVQGTGKSSFIEAISLGYFGEINEKKEISEAKVMNEVTAGKWFIELPELAALLGVHHNVVKNKMSSKTDRARGAYSRYTEDRKRGFVMVGTSNDRRYLQDPTGNRRFWPLRVGVTEDSPVDLDMVRAEIQQVYAEALVAYRQMRRSQREGDLPLFLVGEAAEIAKRVQGEATVESSEQSFAGWLVGWLARPYQGKFSEIRFGDKEYRSKFCAREAWESYHLDNGKEMAPEYDHRAARLVGTAISLVSMVREGTKARFERHGQQRAYDVIPEALAEELGIVSVSLSGLYAEPQAADESAAKAESEARSQRAKAAALSVKSTETVKTQIAGAVRAEAACQSRLNANQGTARNSAPAPKQMVNPLPDGSYGTGRVIRFSPAGAGAAAPAAPVATAPAPQPAPAPAPAARPAQNDPFDEDAFFRDLDDEPPSPHAPF